MLLEKYFRWCRFFPLFLPLLYCSECFVSRLFHLLRHVFLGGWRWRRRCKNFESTDTEDKRHGMRVYSNECRMISSSFSCILSYSSYFMLHFALLLPPFNRGVDVSSWQDILLFVPSHDSSHDPPDSSWSPSGSSSSTVSFLRHPSSFAVHASKRDPAFFSNYFISFCCCCLIIVFIVTMMMIVIKQKNLHLFFSWGLRCCRWRKVCLCLSHSSFGNCQLKTNRRRKRNFHQTWSMPTFHSSFIPFSFHSSSSLSCFSFFCNYFVGFSDVCVSRIRLIRVFEGELAFCGSFKTRPSLCHLLLLDLFLASPSTIFIVFCHYSISLYK